MEPSPGRHSVIRRALVTCLREADRVFDRLWAKLHEMKWLGSETVVVIVGDGAEWIWNRAKQVVHARMRQAGMRWSEAGARRLLALRALLLNNQWSLLERLTMKPLAA